MSLHSEVNGHALVRFPRVLPVEADLQVVKVGSQSLVRDGKLQDGVFDSIAAQISHLVRGGSRVILVTSGAVAAGSALREGDGPSLHAARAAVGQAKVISAWSRAFEKYGQEIGQFLLTSYDLEHGSEGFIEAIHGVTSSGRVAVLNANDASPFDARVRHPIVNDNDLLACRMAELSGAKKLFLLTDAEGVLRDGFPLKRIGADEDLHFLSGAAKSALGTGGIRSKVHAAQAQAKKGVKVLIGPAAHESILVAEGVGTIIALEEECFSDGLRRLAQQTAAQE